MPLYRSVRETGAAWSGSGNPFTVQVGPAAGRGPALPDSRRSRAGPKVYCIEHPYFDRPGLYGEGGADYADNAQRFAFFFLAALEVLPRIARSPAILHAHDWHTALAPVYLRTVSTDSAFHRGLRTVLSVHNAGFQGHFPAETMPDVGLPWELYTYRHLEWYGRVNLLKGGLTFADAAGDGEPHPRARAAHGEGRLRPARRVHRAPRPVHRHHQRHRLRGVGSGDRPAHHRATIPARTWRGKRRCKAALQRSFGLPQRQRMPLFAMTARLTSQKGLELIVGDYTLFMLEAQFVFLGARRAPLRGDAQALRRPLARAHRRPPRLHRADGAPAHGRRRHVSHAVAVRALRTDPDAGPALRDACRWRRRVGGIADTVEDGVTGFLFDEYSSEDLLRVARAVMDYYNDEEVWQRLMREGMSRDFSWGRSAARYLEVYQHVLAHPAFAG